MTLKWKTSTSGPTTTKSEQIEGMGVGVDHKKFGGKIRPLGVCLVSLMHHKFYMHLYGDGW